MPAITQTQPFPIVAWFDRRSSRQRRVGVVLLILLGVALVLRLVGVTLLDRLWFASVTDAPVWATKVGAQLLLGGVAVLVSVATLLGSAVVAYRTPPAPGNSPNRLVRRYRDRMGPAHRWLLYGIAVFLTLRIAAAAMSMWQPWLLFLHGQDLGRTAPDVGFDVGYHLFRLPLLVVISSWLRQLFLVAAGLGLAGYLANGALRFPKGERRSASRVLPHMAILAGAFALLQSLAYIFVSRPATATDRVGPFDGPGWTVVHVVLPALFVLSAAALVAAVASWRSWRTRSWRPMAWAFGGWFALHGVLLLALPAVVQRVVVDPAEGTRELAYIARNLEATRTAYGLDAVEQETLPFSDGISGDLTAEQLDDVERMPLFDEAQLINPLQVLVGTTATRITDVDLDRYEIDGERRPVLVAARNANEADLPERGWVQSHLVYTHGDGIVAVPASAPAPDGRPDVGALAQQLQPARPELYFGEGLRNWYAIVNTRRQETGGTNFAADTGISLSSGLRRLELALATNDFEPLVSAELTDQSQLLFRRGLTERLGFLAPFLSFDGNAYPVVTDDGVTWVIDGYTTSRTYPYAQFPTTSGVPASSGLSRGGFNYAKGSVKATVDAYDGSVHLYRTEVGGADDPILNAWSSIFPGLLEPIDQMPDAIRSHLLYPQDLLTVQTNVLGRYHVQDAETLFSGTDSWAISAAAGAGVARPSNGEREPTGPALPVSLFMPGEDDLGGHWVAIRPYGPGAAGRPTTTREDMTGLAVADHDDPEHLRLIRFEVQPGDPVSSPLVAQAAIDTDRDLASLFTLLNANGSAVQFGPMTPLPLDDALVWARPIIVSGTADTTTPRLYGVATVSEGLVGVGDRPVPSLATIGDREPLGQAPSAS